VDIFVSPTGNAIDIQNFVLCWIYSFLSEDFELHLLCFFIWQLFCCCCKTFFSSNTCLLWCNPNPKRTNSRKSKSKIKSEAGSRKSGQAHGPIQYVTTLLRQ